MNRPSTRQSIPGGYALVGAAGNATLPKMGVEKNPMMEDRVGVVDVEVIS
jgi:hypothetical protein